MDAIYRKILLPVDGSQQSIDAFKRGARQGKVWGSQLYLVQVIADGSDQTTVQNRQNFLNSLENYARQNGISLHQELLYGDPRTQITDELVNRWDIDLIIMGATGKGRIAKMVVGSVTTYVLRHATCDILVSR